ncbi:Cysteine synthase [Rubellimicrobium mesophilum DSM 19309]|uniref:Cysteine synthase n=1 Tax=Rubellimicrobium mesophilum DSM 19309 TaxID=442562 RepID=A0A017HV28_9RHOB|nr:cysteine synthase family protein [Rubellimicrobium mesophilum]EYD77998.1 Cysteine synthase [Rubellimicrobium mesophilum DSM 19309]
MPRTDALGAIGNTPLARLSRLVPEGSAEVWVKLEGQNPTGSQKDRMAVSVILRALERGALRPGERVVEYTAGSTGMALAFVCAVMGLRFTAVSSDAFSPSKLKSMEAYGAEVLIEPSNGEGITPALIARMRERAHALGREPGHFYADQFGSPDVRAGYEGLGREIARQVPGGPDLLVAAVGTGASLMGTLDGLESEGLRLEAVALEPLQSPFLTTGKGGPHKVEGVGVGFAPPFLDLARLREARAVDQERAFETCRRLAREEGIFAGGSTGLNVAAALDLAAELGPGRRVVTFACDSGSKYLGGPIYG